jgi:DNA helicase-2/ATP-dependent DNA helicase PcrA
MEAIEHAPERSILLAAFNKRIADELSARLNNPRAQAKTLHSVGFSFVRRYWPRVQLDGNRGERLAQKAIGEQAAREAIKLVAKIASLAKGVCPTATGPEAVIKTAIEYDKEPDEDLEDLGYTLQRICHAAYNAMQLARGQTEEEKNLPIIDFDDMVFLPVVNKWAAPIYDAVLVDEAQDMNQSQLELALAIVRSRMCVVGDDRQAIYRFRGASLNAIDRMKAILNAQEIGLTVTYRCGKAIVERAKRIVPDFAADESNGPGELVSATRQQMMELADPGDFVLSRTNAPLAGACLGFLRAGKRARIEGKEIGAQLAKTVKERKAKTIEELEEKIEKWQERQLTKIAKRETLSESDARAKADYVNDQAETILVLAEGVATVQELLTRIDQLFNDSDENGKRASIVCSTIHKAKGLEADRVFVLEDTLYPGGDKRVVEEQNLEYVAVTRAKKTLVSVFDIAMPANVLGAVLDVISEGQARR